MNSKETPGIVPFVIALFLLGCLVYGICSLGNNSVTFHDAMIASTEEAEVTTGGIVEISAVEILRSESQIDEMEAMVTQIVNEHTGFDFPGNPNFWAEPVQTDQWGFPKP